MYCPDRAHEVGLNVNRDFSLYETLVDGFRPITALLATLYSAFLRHIK